MQEACRWTRLGKDRFGRGKSLDRQVSPGAKRRASNFLWGLDSEISRSRDKGKESQILWPSVLSTAVAAPFARHKELPYKNQKMLEAGADFRRVENSAEGGNPPNSKKAPTAMGAFQTDLIS